MGAFFLYQTNAAINRSAVETLFAAKGFGAPATHQFGPWTLTHYRKQLVHQECLSASQEGTQLFSVGTFTYKGLGVSRSLETILADYLAGQLDHAELRGAYCLLLCRQETVTFLMDRMSLLQVFFNEEQTVFSSSFAAVLKAGPRKFRVNVLAVLENALTGYVIGPDTTVQGVYVMDEQGQARVTASGLTVHSRDRSGLCAPPEPRVDFSECVAQQLNELDSYFSAFRNLVDEAGGVDIGLSGGYDSRLLILMAKKHFGHIIAHSHFHRQPTADETVAQQVTKELGVPLSRLAGSKQPGDMDVDEFERNVDNTAAFADARVFHDYSWLVFFRTRWYRESLLKDVRFGMNGLGGELYRNHWNQLRPSANSREWLKARVLGQGVYAALPRKRLDEVMDYMLAKASVVLGEQIDKRLSHAQMRRYFGEIFSVYSAGAKICVDNQLAFSLAPYLDYPLRCASYRTLPHIGLDGRFEGEMIRRLNPTVAAITSSYGYPLDQSPPAQTKVRILARSLIPLSLQTKAYTLPLLDRRCVSRNYEVVRQRLHLVRRAEEVMRSSCFGIIWEQTVQDEVLVMRVLSLGLMMLKYGDCLEL